MIQSELPDGVQFTHCGDAVDIECADTSVPGSVPEAGRVSRDGEASAVRRDGSRLEVVGRTYGIGDPRCREVSAVVRRDGTRLRVTVSNHEQPGTHGCRESRKSVFYRLTVDDSVADGVETVAIVHEDDDGDKLLEETVEPS
jgi:hypothetical protein